MAAQDAVAVLERVQIPLASHDKENKRQVRCFIGNHRPLFWFIQNSHRSRKEVASSGVFQTFGKKEKIMINLKLPI